VIPFTFGRKQHSQIIVKIDPAFEKSAALSWRQKFTRPMNKRLGADGLFIGSIGLKICFEELYSRITNIAKTHNPDIRISGEGI